VLAQLDLDQGLEADADGARVQGRVVAGDHPRTLQPADPFMGRRRGQTARGTEFLDGRAGVVLQRVQQHAICPVKWVHRCADPENIRWTAILTGGTMVLQVDVQEVLR